MVLSTDNLVKALATLLLLAAGSQVANAANRYMQTGSVTSQPIGHYEYCQKNPSECTAQVTSANAPKITDYGWDIIRKTNMDVNNAIMPMTDEDIYGRQEVWSLPGEAGDCEDYVLLKRRDLIERGFSPSDLLITVVRKPDGEGHAVLTIHSSEGDYVLDNLDNEVRLWSETPYRFLKRQATFNAGRWVTVENSADVVVGSLEK